MDNNKIWEDLSQESKNEVKRLYRESVAARGKEDNRKHPLMDAIERIFGKENIEIKNPNNVWSWNDIGCDKNRWGMIDDMEDLEENLKDSSFNSKICKKATATIKLYEVKNLGYGEDFTDEEWNDTSIEKHIITYNQFKKSYDIFSINEAVKNILAFRTYEQADAFRFHNKELLDDYFMV